jgi:hypothetical protein
MKEKKKHHQGMNGWRPECHILEGEQYTWGCWWIGVEAEQREFRSSDTSRIAQRCQLIGAIFLSRLWFWPGKQPKQYYITTY